MYKEAACDDSCESETLTDSNTHSRRGTATTHIFIKNIPGLKLPIKDYNLLLVY